MFCCQATIPCKKAVMEVALVSVVLQGFFNVKQPCSVIQELTGILTVGSTFSAINSLESD